MRTPSDSSRCRENSPSTKPGAIHFLFVGECDSAGEQIGERVVLSIGRDDLGDEGIRK